MRRKIKLFQLLTWYKELQEEKTRIRIQETKLLLEKLLSEKAILEEEYGDCVNYLQNQKSFTGEELRNWLSYLETLKEFIQLSEKKIETQKKYLEDLQAELLRKHQEKRLMERLSSKFLRNYEIEKAKAFLKELDDLVLLRKGRGFV